MSSMQGLQPVKVLEQEYQTLLHDIAQLEAELHPWRSWVWQYGPRIPWRFFGLFVFLWMVVTFFNMHVPPEKHIGVLGVLGVTALCMSVPTVAFLGILSSKEGY